jgi:hypothetical protein
MPLETPIALFVWNRPALTAHVLEAIRQADPCQLFIIADGPRPAHLDDMRQCQQVRTLIRDRVWPARTALLATPLHLGLPHRMVSGLDWVFSTVERAIILEDDLRPTPDFFRFCDARLVRYANEPRVFQVNGCRDR